MYIHGVWIRVVVNALSSHGGFFPNHPTSPCAPGVDSASKNEYKDIPGGKGGRCVGVTTLPPSCAECHEIWGALTSWTPPGHVGL